MKYKYQLILLGDLGERSNNIEDLFFEKVAELNLPKDAFVIIKFRDFAQNYTPSQPAFCL